jgi:nitroreductase
MDDPQAALDRRFGRGEVRADAAPVPAAMLVRGSVRRFADAPVDPEAVRLLCAAALSSPTKSDLQQRDIVVVQDPGQRAALAALVADQDWVAQAPCLLVFCGNNRRQRQIHAWRGHPFPNDHLDAFFNAAVDAAIALAAFVTAAEAAGYGCCPISAVRNRADEVSALLGLPDHVFPVAGLGLGHPAAEPVVSPRLPLEATVHLDRFSDEGIREAVEAYDARRAAVQPFRRQRMVETLGSVEPYGWSEDKARQYSVPEREDWGAFVRAKGFDLR